MKKSKIIRKKYSEIIKIDSEVWQGITKELTNCYDERNVIIETEVGAACQTQDLDEAYAKICSLNDDITRIKITANTKTTATSLIFTNAHTKRGITAEFYSECTDMMDAFGARDFFFETAINMRLFRYGIIVNSLAILWLNVIVLFNRHEWLENYSLSILLAYPVVITAFYFPLRKLIRLIQGEKHIQFLTDKANVQEYIKKDRRRIRKIYIVYWIITLVVLGMLLWS